MGRVKGRTGNLGRLFPSLSSWDMLSRFVVRPSNSLFDRGGGIQSLDVMSEWEEGLGWGIGMGYLSPEELVPDVINCSGFTISSALTMIPTYP